jgi:dolichol-phosphate mannosyltransferase
MKIKTLLTGVALTQLLLALSVITRLLKTARGTRLPSVFTSHQGEQACLSIIVPVLNEYTRLAPCLEGLIKQSNEVGEILVVDGGSCDGTQELVRCFQQRDPRIRFIDASPVPPDWNGKVWGLSIGAQHASTRSRWLLTIDADVRPASNLVRSLLAYTEQTNLTALSLATLQEIAGFGQGLLHPAMLTTLVYRFGIPGHVMRNIHTVQANGQCFLVQRSGLAQVGGFRAVRASLCEDITLARMLVAHGHAVGFYEAEAGSLASVKMYECWQDTWQNWTRSLPMHDRFSGWHTLIDWLEILCVQALPLPLLLLFVVTRRRNQPLILLNGWLVALRFGVLFGTARAYQHRPWSYWLSPLCDLPVACKLVVSLLRRRHIWRGRVIYHDTFMEG